MTKNQQSERDGYITRLRETLKPGDTLCTVIRSVSRSGMSRVIDVFKFVSGDMNPDGTQRPPVKLWLSYQVAKACGMTFQNRSGLPEGIKIGGCGMDMGFAIVYELGRTLWPQGFGEPCQLCHKRPQTQEEANDATARRKRTSCPIQTPFRHQYRGRNGDISGWDTDGGYALHQEWI